MNTPILIGFDPSTGEDLGLRRARCPLAVIKGIASWAHPSMALRFDAAAQTLPYMTREPKEQHKPNGSPRQRRHR